MEELDSTPALVTDIEEGATSGPQSPFEALRARRDEVAARREVYIPLPDYRSEGLNVRYRLVERQEVNEINRRVRKQTRDQAEYMFRVIIDTMIAACDGFYMIPPGLSEEDAEPLMSPDGREHVETYGQMAKHLRGGQAFESQRQAVLYVFGDNDFAVGQHGLLLNRWLSNTGIDINQEFLEEG